ncbi:putative ABC transport system permease protein [Luteibacter sp. Sphag1AF]|uniref:ABC transporter permease n=1 Tax=Luteibacter sp. Sphag1AF TaxID=2587031 RepID=UPI00160728D3|nr:FtsX-like permease family protein [Luteibacter sp. Sphag1AF]MBB3226608.1 putative ABC transport system permease protein [Luteibacter sp. Sphag1AF]
MQIKPILSALRHHRLATTLIALQIALACAVLCNACFLIANRWHAMELSSGINESSLALLSITGYDETQAKDINARVIAGLQSIPGMKSVSAINAAPFARQAGVAGVTLDREEKRNGGVVDFYVSGPGTWEALGLKLIAGEAPKPDDYGPIDSFVPANANVLVTGTLAQHFWPGANPLGKEFWVDKFHFRVTGVVEHLATAQPGGRGPESVDWSVFTPAQPGTAFSGTYLLRADPADISRVLRDASNAIATIVPEAVLDRDNTKTIADFRHDYFRSDRAMARILVGVIVSLLLVTALGIVGLASFWVDRRRKQIGIRRAIGATRGDILRYFQLENLLIVTFGVVLGVAAAYVLNDVLMRYYELPRLPVAYLVAGACVQWILGQLAVLGPAIRAAAVPPVVATRSV